jgi:hypothetical protein
MALMIMSASVYHSMDESLAKPNAGAIQLYGHSTTLQPWQLDLGLAVFALIGLAMVIMGLVRLLRK